MVDSEFVKIEFEKYRLWIRKKKELTDKLKSLEEELYELKGINYVANNIKILRDQKALEYKKLDLIERKDLIEKQIAEVDKHIDYLVLLADKTIGMERIFIIAHYFQFKSHSEIAEEYNYSRRSVGYIIDRGFKRIAYDLEEW